MKTSRYGLLTLLSIALFSFATATLADPPAGKGNKGGKADYSAGQSGQGKNKADKENKGQDKSAYKGEPGKDKGAKGDKDRPGAYQTDGKPLVRGGVTVETARRWVTELNIDRRGYSALPPGIAKNLARGKPLPPGIAKKALPPRFVERLPVYPGYDWYSAGLDVILVYRSSGVVADILLNVF